mgnify:CR=1 FL=1
MKNYFVTGGEGFVGRHLVQHLVQRGHHVVGGVRNRARKLSFEKQLGKALVCDVSDAISVARAIASVKPEVVVHLASTSQPAFANQEPLTAYQSIVSGWANVLDGVRRAVPRAKVLLISAADVYGNACTPEQPATEDTPVQPCDTFGSLKAAAESIAQTFYLNYHLDITTLRPFCLLGPGLPEQFFFGSLARRFCEWDMASHGKTCGLADSDYQRDAMHVADFIEALDRLTDSGRPNCTYNICSGQHHSVRDIAQALARAANLDLNFTADDTAEPGPIACLWGDASRLSQHTGWKPSRSLDQAAGDLIASCRAQVQPAAAH